MEKEIYESTQIQISLMCSILIDIPLADFVKAINRCETVAPIIDPTLWIRGEKNLEQIKIQAEALLEAQNYLRKHGHALIAATRNNRTNVSGSDSPGKQL